MYKKTFVVFSNLKLKNVSKVLVDGKEMTTQEAMEAVKGKEIQNSLITQPDGSEVLSIKTRGYKDAPQPLIVLDGKIIEVPKDAAKDIKKLANGDKHLTEISEALHLDTLAILDLVEHIRGIEDTE